MRDRDSEPAPEGPELPTGTVLIATFAVITLLLLGRSALDADLDCRGGWGPVEALTTFWYSVDARAEVLGHDSEAPTEFARPLWTSLQEGLFRLFGVRTTTATLFPLFGAVLATLFVVVVAPIRIGGAGAAFTAAVVLCTSPAFVGSCRIPSPAPLAGALLALILLECASASRWKPVILAGVALAVGAVLDFTIALAAAPLLYSAARGFEGLRDRKYAAVAAFGVGLALAIAIAGMQGVRFAAPMASFSVGGDAVLVLLATVSAIAISFVSHAGLGSGSFVARSVWFTGLGIAVLRDERAIETLAAIAPVGAMLTVYGFAVIADPERFRFSSPSRALSVITIGLAAMILPVLVADAGVIPSAVIAASVASGILLLAPLARAWIGNFGVALMLGIVVLVDQTPRWLEVFDPDRTTRSVAQRELDQMLLPTARVAGLFAPALAMDSEFVVDPVVRIDRESGAIERPLSTHLLGRQGVAPPRAFRSGPRVSLLPIESFQLSGMSIALYRTGVEGSPRSEFEECALLALRGDLEGAEDALLALLGNSPGFASAWSRLGDLRLQQGHPEFAYVAYLHALERDPARVAARVGLAAIYEIAGETDVAIEHLQSALEVAPGDPWILEKLHRLR